MSSPILRGQWVEIHRVVLAPEERTSRIPAETRVVPLELRVKGWLDQDSAVIGDEVSIRTVIGRTMNGTLKALNPRYLHDFGRPVPELQMIGTELRKLFAAAQEGKP